MNSSIKLSGHIPYFLKHLQYRWADKCWSKRDIQRVYKKIKELATVKKTYKPIEFDDAEMLSYLLDEPLDCRLYWSIRRLLQDDLIALYPLDSDNVFWCIEPIPF